MKEITLNRYHDILYKFFAILTCLGVFMLAMDLLALVNKKPIFMFGHALYGWDNLYGIIPVIIMIFLCYEMARYHLKGARQAKWR